MDTLESIPGLLKSLRIRALITKTAQDSGDLIFTRIIICHLLLSGLWELQIKKPSVNPFLPITVEHLSYLWNLVLEYPYVFSSPAKAISDRQSSDTLPSKGFRWPEMGNFVSLPVISGSYLPTALVKKRIRFSIYATMVVQKSNIGHIKVA